jgi:hypothetical protein
LSTATATNGANSPYLFNYLSNVTLTFNNNNAISATLGGVQKADAWSTITWFNNSITHNTVLPSAQCLFGLLINTSVTSYALVLSGVICGVL